MKRVEVIRVLQKVRDDEAGAMNDERVDKTHRTEDAITMVVRCVRMETIGEIAKALGVLDEVLRISGK